MTLTLSKYFLAAVLLSVLACAQGPTEPPVDRQPTEASLSEPVASDTAPPGTAAPSQEAAAILSDVRGTIFTASDLVRRILVVEAIRSSESEGGDIDVIPFEYLQGWIIAEILRQEAPGMGIAPSEEEISAELITKFQAAPAEDRETDAGQRQSDPPSAYQSYLEATGLSDSEYRLIVQEGLTEFALFLKLGQNIASNQEQVEVRWIRLPVSPQAPGYGEVDPMQVLERLKQEPFDAVAREVSEPNGSTDATGYVGWVPRGAYPELDPVLFGVDSTGTPALRPGYISLPYYASDEIYIIEILSPPELRELGGRAKVLVAAEAVKAWQSERLTEGLEDGSVEITFNRNLYEWVLQQVLDELNPDH